MNVIAVRNNKTVYRDRDTCIKVFNQDFSKADILNEALNVARVEETDLNIPKVLEVTKFEGNWAIVYEYIEGETLAQLMEKHPEKKDDYLKQFVDLQLLVQSKTCPLLGKLTDKMNRKIGQADLDEATRYNLYTRLAGMPKHRKLCHGDFNPSNIIIAEDGTPYILDWSHVTQGNASADVARTYLLFWLNNEGDIAKKYLDLFCQKSNTSMEYVLKWTPIVAASQSVKGKKHERDFLLSWVDVVDYI